MTTITALYQYVYDNPNWRNGAVPPDIAEFTQFVSDLISAPENYIINGFFMFDESSPVGVNFVDINTEWLDEFVFYRNQWIPHGYFTRKCKNWCFPRVPIEKTQILVNYATQQVGKMDAINKLYKDIINVAITYDHLNTYPSITALDNLLQQYHHAILTIPDEFYIDGLFVAETEFSFAADRSGYNVDTAWYTNGEWNFDDDTDEDDGPLAFYHINSSDLAKIVGKHLHGKE